MAWLYGPMAAGAAADVTADRRLTDMGGTPEASEVRHARGGRLGRLDDLIGADAAGADPKTANAAVDERPNLLKIGLETAGADIVRVAVDPANDRGLATKFTVLGHDDSHRRAQPASRKRPSIAEPARFTVPESDRLRYPTKKNRLRTSYV